MKNTDYNLGKDYDIIIMSSKELKDKLMKDNSLTEEDIFFHYSLNSWHRVQTQITSLKGNISLTEKYPHLFNSLSKTYIAYKNGFIENKDIQFVDGVKSIETACDELGITKKPYLDDNGLTYNDFIKEFNMDFMCWSERKYGTCDLETAINETLEYNMNIFNKNRIVATEEFNQGIENSCIVVNEREDGRYELIDGFYRVLYKNIDRNVIVKVYKNVTDEEWFKLMINCNYWKTNVSKALFYERGKNARVFKHGMNYHNKGKLYVPLYFYSF